MIDLKQSLWIYMPNAILWRMYAKCLIKSLNHMCYVGIQYSKHRFFVKALKFYYEMHQVAIIWTHLFFYVFSRCVQGYLLSKRERKLYRYNQKWVWFRVFFCNSLVDMYTECRKVGDTSKRCFLLPMIVGYVLEQMSLWCVRYFSLNVVAYVKSNSIRIVSLVKEYSNSTSLQ